MQIALALVTLCLMAASAQAQLNLGLGLGLGLGRSFAGFPPTQFFSDVVLQSESQKLLATPNLPEDLQQRVVDAMANAETGFSDCNAASATTLPWLQIRCVTLQLKKAKDELKVIEDEANARAAAATVAASGNGAVA